MYRMLSFHFLKVNLFVTLSLGVDPISPWVITSYIKCEALLHKKKLCNDSFLHKTILCSKQFHIKLQKKDQEIAFVTPKNLNMLFSHFLSLLSYHVSHIKYFFYRIRLPGRSQNNFFWKKSLELNPMTLAHIMCPT